MGSAQTKQIQEFNGKEQIQLKQGQGRFNLFTTLDSLSVYLKNKLGLLETNSETLYISIQDEIAGTANGTHIPPTANDTLGIVISIASIDSTGNTHSITGVSNQVFNNVSNFALSSGGVFTSFTYNPADIDPTHVGIEIYVNASNVSDSSQMSFIARTPFGKGNQTVQFFIQKVSI